MTNVRRATAFLAVLLVFALVGCSGGNTSHQESPASVTFSATSRTTEAPASDSEKAADAAVAVVRAYFQIRDQLRKNSDEPLARLKSVATSTELSTQLTLFRSEREEGRRQTGSTELAQVRVQSVNLDNAAPDAGSVPTVEVDVCWDVSSVDVLDADGNSVISPDRPDRGWIRYTVANYEWTSNPTDGWRVATSHDLEDAPCAA